MTDTEDLWPLYDIAVALGDVTPHQLAAWARRPSTTGFPAPKASVGRYNLYSLQEVKDWYFLWRRATKRMKMGASRAEATRSNDDSGQHPTGT